MSVLVDNRADIERRDVYKRTAISSAACQGHKDLVEFLYEKGSKVNVQDNTQRTPLSLAAESGQKAAWEY